MPRRRSETEVGDSIVAYCSKRESPVVEIPFAEHWMKSGVPGLPGWFRPDRGVARHQIQSE